VQEIVTPAEDPLAGFRLTATYEIYPRLTIRGDQPGIKLTVDGTPCGLPCTLDRPSGSTISLSVPETIATGPDSRLAFHGWNDSPSASRTYRLTADDQIRFSYRTFHRLIALADPAEAGSIQIEPSSPDGFYPSDAAVQVTAVSNEGFRFRRWDGDLTHTIATGVVSMTLPQVVRAQFDKVPHISSAGIRNAAADTPTKAVAAGSVISIFGSNLADAYVPGPSAGVLPQTLGNVTVRVGGTLLPLLFVSPRQINAYLPTLLPDGEHTLAVRNGLRQEINGTFTVVRHAPGIFGQTIDERFILTALRPDGSVATPEKPARRGEQITFLGTGFGPYQRPLVDGFPAPEPASNPLAESPVILVGDTVYRPDFAGAAPGMVGVALIRFTIPADWPAAAFVELRVRQGGIESNPVLLPLE
jgi:uncharacterized protein (TIGR03437 family)